MAEAKQFKHAGQLAPRTRVKKPQPRHLAVIKSTIDFSAYRSFLERDVRLKLGPNEIFNWRVIPNTAANPWTLQ